jgi:alpha-tubulin suppressor-like RCC1 family protein
LVVQWLPCPSDVASLDCTARLFHIGDPISVIEEGLRLRAKATCHWVGVVLPPGEVSWTQWLLWVERHLVAIRNPVVACFTIHSAFVDADGQLLTCGACYAPGPLMDGVLGQGIHVLESKVPQRVSGLDRVHIVSVALGWSHTLALSDEGVVFTFGRGDSGQLGYNVEAVQLIPRQIDSLTDVSIIAVAAGHNNSLAVGITGELWTFGTGTCGQLGQGVGHANEHIHRPRLVTALQGVFVSAVSANQNHSIVLSGEGHIYTFGKDGSGQLGHGYSPNIPGGQTSRGSDAGVSQYSPRRIESLLGVKICGVAAGWDHSLAVSSTGSLYTFGSGQFGQLGHGDNLRDQFTPMLVAALQGIRILVAAGGFEHSLVVGEHNVYSFGNNTYGELGHGDVDSRVLPTVIELLGGLHIHSISAGSGASVAATVNGEAYGWGIGVEYEVPPGQSVIPIPLLGLELTADQLVPLRYPTMHLHA